MMKEIKKIWKLIKYGYNFKMNVILATVFTVIGIAFAFLGSAMSSEIHMQPSMLSTMYVLLGPIMIVQISYTLLFCSIVKSSPKNYTLEVTGPNLFTVIIGIAAYLFSILAAIIGMKISPELADSYHAVIISSGILIAVILVYFGICYKYFVAGTIIFIIGFAAIYGGVTAMILKTGIPHGFTTLNSCLLSGAAVAIGVIVSCILRKLLYKKPLSKLSAGAYLRKAMQ